MSCVLQKSVDREELLRMLGGLAQPAKRAAAIPQISSYLGIETLLLFTKDEEVGCLLAAPGFPQTLPDSASWEPFLKACAQQTRYQVTLPYPKPGVLWSVTGLAWDKFSVLALVGDVPDEQVLGMLEAALPLLSTAVDCERLAAVRGTQLDLAQQVARESTALAVGLDNARRGAQQEIVSRKRIEETLRVTRDELARTNAALEARVEERTRRLRETVADLEAFSYSVSHDMRAPLRAMQAYATVLVEDLGPRLDASERSHLDRISRAAQKLDRLIRDVLTYSRLAHDEVKLESVDLDATVRDAIGNYPELQEPHAVVIVPEPLPCILGHETLVGQCVSNLLMNAVKFVAAGVKPQVTVRCEDCDPLVKIWIEDNGIGIAPHNQTRMFGMFQRLNPEGTFTGTGIGLSIAKKAMERMGGGIGVVSGEDRGSRFWLTFSKVPSPGPEA